MTDPRFPKRPESPDFWLLSEVLVAHDAEMDQGGNFDDAVARYIEPKAIVYAAKNQAGVSLQRLGRKPVYISREVEAMVASSFISAFLAGMKYQIRKDVDHQAAQFPWVVDHFTPDLLPGQQGELVARFTTKEYAEKFIGILAETDPEGVDRGDYGVVGPNEDEGDVAP